MDTVALSSPGGGPEANTFRRSDMERDRATQLTVAGALVASITHDLRQPLTALEMNISAALQLLQPGALHVDEALDALHDALVQQGRMREALQALHDLAVHREPHYEAVELAPIVHDVAGLVGTEVLAQHAVLELDLPPTLPPVFGDPGLIRQALLNIVLDALEAASPAAHPRKTVCVSVRPVEGAVEVTVSHFGLRTEAAIDDWGLALARSVVEAHHGSIVMEGDADAGVRLVTRWPTRIHPNPQGDPHA